MHEHSLVKVLTVRQPWAHLIVSGHKDIENRSWQTPYRGLLYIHAGSHMHATPIPQIERRFGLSIDPEQLILGAIVGWVMLTDIVQRSDSPWFDGPYGWVLEHAQAFAGASIPGRQKIFDIPEKIVRPPPSRAGR
jgi:hypothetical protein